MNELPIPKKPNIEQNDAEQKALAKVPPARSRGFGVIEETERVPPHLLTSFQLEDYAEALADVGRWEDAAKLDTPRKEFYAQVVDAIYLDDAYTCDCPETRGKKDDRYSTWFVMREVFSPVHGQAKLWKCNACADLNVR